MGYQKGPLCQHCHVRRHHNVPRYCRQNAEGDHRSCPIHHQDQDHCSTRESTPSGSEDPSLLPFPPSNRCGSPSRNTMSAAQQLSTASASKYFILLFISCDANIGT